MERLTYWCPDGKGGEKNSAPFPSVVVVFTEKGGGE